MKWFDINNSGSFLVPVVSADQFDKDGDTVDKSRGRVRGGSIQHESNQLCDNDLALQLVNQNVGSNGRLLWMR